MRITKSFLILPTLAILTLTSVAHAHPGHADAGFLPGISHPFSGLDHLLAMIAVGIWAAQQGGKARWLLPLSFMGFMLAGGAAGFNFPGVPFTETAVASTVLILGLLVAAATRLPLAAGVLLTAVFAMCHGYAHGAELPGGASPLAYSVGFFIATGILHTIGIAIGWSAQKIKRPRLLRTAGLAISTAAVAIFITLL